MLTKLITRIKEYFYVPKIGDIYFRDIRPGFLFDPWECENIRKENIVIEDIKEGYIKYTCETSSRKIFFREVMQIRRFKSYFTRRI